MQESIAAVGHRIHARAPRQSPPPDITTDPGIVSSFLDDAAHVSGGSTPGVAFPSNEADVSALVRLARSVLPVGAQSSLTGGATPRGEVVLSTRAMNGIDTARDGRVHVGAGVPLATLQRALAGTDAFYPPAPTYDGAFVGGTIATNAAGAATFKHGTTRAWVEALTVVLASGDVLDLQRGDVSASPEGLFTIVDSTGTSHDVRIPGYAMPDVAKLSAGYFSSPGMDLIDLFIGSEGTLGVVVDATLRVAPRPRACVALVTCANEPQALDVTAALRDAAHRAWFDRGPLDISAIEYIDANALTAVTDEALVRAGLARPATGQVLLLVQIDVHDNDTSLDAFVGLLEAHAVAEDPVVAMPGDVRGAQRLFDLREAVPAGVNATIGRAKAAVDARIEKTAGDMVVPFPHLADSLALYRREFERRGLRYAVWGHVSDGNLHPNVIPQSFDDVLEGREALIAIAREVTAMGGAPLAEHGVGRSATKQRLLRELYGDAGIAAMQRVKAALDPEWKLAPGVLFPRPA